MQKRFLFHTIISAFCVSVALAAPQVQPENHFFLKLGTFSNQENALKLQSNLNDKHHVKAQIKSSGTYKTVEFGPYDTKEAAKAFKETHSFAKKALIVKKVSPPKTVVAAKPDSSSSTGTTKPSQQVALTEKSELGNTKSTNLSQFKSPKTEPVKKGAKLAIAEPQAQPKPLPTKLWNLRQANIRSVIQAVSAATGKNFLIDPRVQGKITVVSSKPINADELYQVFLSMLQVSGYAAIPSGGVVKIVPNIDARSIGGDNTWIDTHGKGDDMIVKVVPIKYVSAEQLVPVIRPLMPQWSNVSAYSPSNMLILSGRADNINRLSYIINQVDTASSNGIDVITLRHALAMDVVTTIKALTDAQKNRMYQHNATIAADDKSNTILVSGSKTERLRIRLLVDQLDNKNAQNVGNTEVVYLRFLKAQDILPILSGVAKANFSGSVGTTVGTITVPTLDTSTLSNASDSGDDGSNASSSSLGGNDSQSTSNNRNFSQNTQASSDSSEGNSKPKVQIIADPNTNSIILNAPRALMRTFKTIIAKLDTRPAQVLVEALITEIDESDVNQLGLQWGTMSPSTDSSGNTSVGFSSGFAIINSNMRLNDFQARLTALVTTNKANILSTPSVVVLDNRQAKILVGQQISIQDSNYPGNSGGTGQTNPFNTFTRQNVALHLYVRPQISQGNSIQLQIDHGNDSLPTNIQNNLTSGRPVVNTSRIQTSVLVKSGDILVLGGLVQNRREHGGSKIPILGDLPGLGKVFQDNSRSKTRKVLMVFIRPIIMDNNRDSLKVTGSKYFQLRDEQLDFMKYKPHDPEYKQMVFHPLKENAKLPVPFAGQRQKRS